MYILLYEFVSFNFVKYEYGIRFMYLHIVTCNRMAYIVYVVY